MPICELPSEILLCIFIHARKDLLYYPETLLCLSSVCSRWRMILLTTGSLWQMVYVTLPLGYSTIRCANIFITRSNPYPLDILIDIRDPEWDWDEETHSATAGALRPLISLLMQHSQRWRTVEIVADNWTPIYTFLSLTNSSILVPNLQTLTLSRCNAYMAAPGQTFQPTNLRTPVGLLGGIENDLKSLTALSLVGVHVDWNEFALPNLTHLEFRYQASDVMPSADQFCRMLGVCSALRELMIMGWGPILSQDDSPPRGSLDLHELKKFTFGFFDVEYAVRLLPLFRLPRLKILVVEDVNPIVNPVATVDATPLLQTLIRLSRPIGLSSSCLPLSKVLAVELHSLLADNTSFHNLFQQFDAIEYLHLDRTTDGSLELLASPNLDPLCPLLKTLHCIDMSPTILTATLAARTRRIVHVTAEFVRNTPPAADSPLMKRMADGKIAVLLGSRDYGFNLEQ